MEHKLGEMEKIHFAQFMFEQQSREKGIQDVERRCTFYKMLRMWKRMWKRAVNVNFLREKGKRVDEGCKCVYITFVTEL